MVKAINVETIDKEKINIPWHYVDNIGKNVILKSKISDINAYILKNKDIMLLRDVMDRQVVDLEGQKIRRVNDLKVSETNGYYHIIGVDIGIQGILRRLGFKKIIERIGPKGEDIIAWNDIDPWKVITPS